MKSVWIVSLTIGGLFLFLSLLGFYLAIRPFKFNSSITPAQFHLPYEKISFHTRDHLLLHGWFIPSKATTKKTIILLHGYPADKGDILPSMLFLHQHFNLLLFDFRYFGESEGAYSTIGKKEVDDLLAAINYLKNRGITEVGVWGFSMGGAIALMTAEKTTAIKAIVAESPYARLDWLAYDYFNIPLLRYPLGVLLRLWGILFLGHDIKTVAPANVIAHLSIPILLIHSKQDAVISYDHAVLLKQQAKSNVESIDTDQLQHGELMENHAEIIAQFFNRHL
jgi:uncharacterized protein